MTRSTFQVLFYLKRQSKKRQSAGYGTYYCERHDFAVQLQPERSSYVVGHACQQSPGKSVEAQLINEKLENIKTNIGKQYQRICDRDSYVTAEKVKTRGRVSGTIAAY